MKQERGQERDPKRTVGNRSPGSRPRIRKEETTGTTGRSKRVIRTGTAYPEEVVKARKKTVIPPLTGTGKRIGKSRPEPSKEEIARPKRVFKERTSDVFRRTVINKPTQKRFEETETDSFLTAKGKVLRGKLGKKNVINELDREKRSPLANKPKNDGTIRLNRFIANSGMCSRREADTYIATGCVTVNGEIVSEMGHKVRTGDSVSFNGKLLSIEKKVYVLLNKPKGFVTTVEDPHADKTVMELVQNACFERIYPVGRLDKNTTGLLLFTNDGDLTKRLTHPKYNRKKIYHVHLDQKVSKAHLDEIVNGVTLEDGFVAADSVSYADEEDKKQVGIEIHSGKNKIVRRIFEHLGYKVVRLDRVYFCGLTKKNLPRGKWRFLTQEEVNMLKMSSN
ncbi:MAG: rRNA pseudouridine synthase [Bacteroidetes bacterium]|nr:rRNA pseudouridine synthase [Bacteroidota bacterium]MCL6103631.1 rRNA pseudouridine synthase [Bacteroidota bacterium]